VLQFVALGGAGYSATGGNFILGQANTRMPVFDVIRELEGRAPTPGGCPALA